MRRLLVTVGTCAVVSAAVPASALAHHHHHHHHRHHHAARTERFGHFTTTSAPAGTVFSFASHILTILLPDGSKVSGRVSDETDLRCVRNQSSGGDMGKDDHGQGNKGNDRGRGDDKGPGDDRGRGDDKGHGQGDDNGPGDDKGSGQEGSAVPCSPGDLQPGRPVLEAVLRITSDGSFWREVIVVPHP